MIIELTTVGWIILIAAVADFIYQNFVVGPKEKPFGWRWPFLRDLPAMAMSLDVTHDLMSDNFERHDTRAYTVRVANIKMHVVCDPDDVRHVQRDNFSNYKVSTGMRGEALRDILGAGMLLSDGPHWRAQRKHASREFNANFLRNAMMPALHRHINVLFDIFEKSSGDPKPVDVQDLYGRFTFDVFGSVAFGADFGNLAGTPNKFSIAFDIVQSLIVKRFVGKPPFVWKAERALGIGDEAVIARCMSDVDQFVRKLIKERSERVKEEAAKWDERQQEGCDDAEGDDGGDCTEDLLTRLVAIASAADDVDDKELYIRDMSISFLLGGRDTTSCALSWFTFEMTQHPEVEAKLLEEIDTVCGTRAPAFDDCQSMPYLNACLHESLRLHPSTPSVPKTAESSDILPSGIRVGPGDTVAFPPYSMGRRKFLWGDDALTFRPERWLDEKGSFCKVDPFKFSAFGNGPRQCIGMDLALLELKITVTMLWQRFHFKYAGAEAPRYNIGLILSLRGGLPVIVSNRRH